MMQAKWYVTVELHKSGTLPKPRSPRLTSTFETEAAAKDFARARLREGRLVFAGTINPVVPRRTVLSQDIASWVAEEQER
jgi:hypothetical protein